MGLSLPQRGYQFFPSMLTYVFATYVMCYNYGACLCPFPPSFNDVFIQRIEFLQGVSPRCMRAEDAPALDTPDPPRSICPSFRSHTLTLLLGFQIPPSTWVNLKVKCPTFEAKYRRPPSSSISQSVRQATRCQCQCQCQCQYQCGWPIPICPCAYFPSAPVPQI